MQLKFIWTRTVYSEATIIDQFKMRNYRSFVQNNSMNYVLNNIVDKDVQTMLLPMNITQFISFSPKYRIKNNCITPNSSIISCFSLIGALTLICVIVSRTYLLLYYRDQLGLSKFLNITTLVDCIFYSIGFAINFIIGIIHTKNNVKFVLLFQRVHRLLNNETSFNHFIIWNWIIVIMAFSWNFAIFTFFYITLPVPWFYFIVGYFFIVFDFNVVYAIRVLKMIENKLELWNTRVLNSIGKTEKRGEDFSKRMFQAYVDILKCYDLTKVCFQILILYYIVEVFLHSFIYIQEAIEMLQMGLEHNIMPLASMGMSGILIWLVKDLTWLTMFMQRCDAFYLAVQNSRDSCTLILKSNCSDDEKRLYKNVLRVHRASFSKMRVCGLFYADAALQLSLMSHLANFTIVLLQFAFL